MASALVRGGATRRFPSALLLRRGFARVATGDDIVAAAPGAALQKARTWDEGVSSSFATTPVKELFQGKKVVIFGLPGAYTGVCSTQHVPSYTKNIDKFKAKGIDSVICVAVNDPYTMNAWAEKLQAKDAIEFYGDFDGKFHKSLELDIDLSAALLGPRSHRCFSFCITLLIRGGQTLLYVLGHFNSSSVQVLLWIDLGFFILTSGQYGCRHIVLYGSVLYFNLSGNFSSPIEWVLQRRFKHAFSS